MVILTATITGANPVTDGVNLVQIIGLGVLALLPMLIQSLMRFAVTRRHRWDFVEGLTKAAAATVLTLNVCIVAWYAMKFVNTADFATVATCALGLAWYLCWGFLTCVLFPAFRTSIQRWADSES